MEEHKCERARPNRSRTRSPSRLSSPSPPPAIRNSGGVKSERPPRIMPREVPTGTVITLDSDSNSDTESRPRARSPCPDYSEGRRHGRNLSPRSRPHRRSPSRDMDISNEESSPQTSGIVQEAPVTSSEVISLSSPPVSPRSPPPVSPPCISTEEGSAIIILEDSIPNPPSNPFDFRHAIQENPFSTSQEMPLNLEPPDLLLPAPVPLLSEPVPPPDFQQPSSLSTKKKLEIRLAPISSLLKTPVEDTLFDKPPMDPCLKNRTNPISPDQASPGQVLDRTFKDHRLERSKQNYMQSVSPLSQSVSPLS